MSKNNGASGEDVPQDFFAIAGVFWPMALAMRMFEESSEFYAKNLRLIMEQSTLRSVPAMPKM